MPTDLLRVFVCLTATPTPPAATAAPKTLRMHHFHNLFTRISYWPGVSAHVCVRMALLTGVRVFLHDLDFQILPREFL